MIPKTATEEDIRDEFAQWGDVESVTIVKEKNNGPPKGFGYVRFTKCVSNVVRLICWTFRIILIFYHSDSTTPPWPSKTVPQNTRLCSRSLKDQLAISGINMAACRMTTPCTVAQAAVVTITMAVEAMGEAVASTMTGMCLPTTTCPHFFECKMSPSPNPLAWRLLSAHALTRTSSGGFLTLFPV